QSRGETLSSIRGRWRDSRPPRLRPPPLSLLDDSRLALPCENWPSGRLAWHQACSTPRRHPDVPARSPSMRTLALAALVLLFAPIPAVAMPQATDEALGHLVAAAVRSYARFTIFDDVTVRVNDQHVTLVGRVTMPAK